MTPPRARGVTNASFIESLKVKNITIESFEEGLKLRSLKMLAHREMENPDFSFA